MFEKNTKLENSLLLLEVITFCHDCGLDTTTFFSALKR